ncbi:MAG: hypothetical protein OEM23_05835 [Gemmatimonadota bacterium]|nr:hypothetical protein [Gemmatimonadota bacterium]
MGELIPIVAIVFTIGVPGMALAAHFVLRPMVKDIVEAMRGGAREELTELQSRVAELQEDVARQEGQLAVLAEAESFRRQLEARET